MIPDELRSEYNAFFVKKTSEPGRYWKKDGGGDGKKLMLHQLPYVGTDFIEAGGSIPLYVRPVKYSQVLFYQERFTKNASFVQERLDALANTDVVQFPSSMCLHAVVVTRDENIVAVRRASSVHYYPGKYAATLEEQLNPSRDRVLSGDLSVDSWVQRALREEMALEVDTHYQGTDIRVLSVFLEHTIMNLSVCALVRLKLSDHELRGHLKKEPRDDHEFDELKFLSCDDALRELRAPSLDHHPTSRYRLFMALQSIHGLKWIKHRLLAGLDSEDIRLPLKATEKIDPTSAPFVEHAPAVFETRRQQLRALWTEVITSTDPTARGRSLESFAETFFSENFKVVERTVRTDTEELDLVLERTPTTDPRFKDTYFFVECKNWLGRSVGQPEISALLGKLNLHHRKQAFLLTSGEFTEPARQQTTHAYSASEIEILLLDGHAIEYFLSNLRDVGDFLSELHRRQILLRKYA